MCLTLVANVLPNPGPKDLKHRLHDELGKGRNLPLLKSDSWILLDRTPKTVDNVDGANLFQTYPYKKIDRP